MSWTTASDICTVSVCHLFPHLEEVLHVVKPQTAGKNMNHSPHTYKNREQEGKDPLIPT
jgi:hypothetical protein